MVAESDALAQYPYGPPAPAPAPPLQQVQLQPQYSYGPAPQYGAQPRAPTSASSRNDEDSGRKLQFFYARTGAAGALVSMGAIADAENVRLGSGFGGAFELALGLRMLVFTVGPRGRLLLLAPETSLWQLGGEVAFHIPMGRFEPFAGVQGGYTFGSSETKYRCATACPSRLSLAGADVGLAGGADYYLTPQLSLGAAANFMFLFLSRKGVDGSPDQNLANSESMTGLGVTLGFRAALHL